ncbi:MAG: glutamate synthase subunit beta [Phycisphaerae bacterium]
MGKPTGFMEYKRTEPPHRPVRQRKGDFFEVELHLDEAELRNQAARCMDCGIPFCHGCGCSLANLIPEFNDMVYRGRWREASELLHATNNFPEITGRICPAPCEAACTLNVSDDPVLIRHIERQVAERAFEEGWVAPRPASKRTGRKVAVIGSGPAGLAAAQQLARAGHEVTVFEKSDRIGGLLRYGIPDFKLEKRILDRRLEQLRAEGVQFQTGVVAGEDLSARYLRKMFDAVLLAMGSTRPRDLTVPGRGLDNVVFAMDFLARQNRLVAGDDVRGEGPSAFNRVVVVIGGGDTGSDCVGTAIRQGAKEVHQFEILPRPPEGENLETPWPDYPRILRTTTSHEEGCQRRWSVKTTKLVGRGVKVAELHGVEVDWQQSSRGPRMVERKGTEFSMPVDLVVLAMGFVHVEHSGLVESLGLELDDRGNISADGCATSVEGVFVAGDAGMGASLVVRAIESGRSAAEAVNRRLSQD